jgi:hypothetical protein
MDALPKGVKAVKLAACIFAALACMAPLPALLKAAALGLANCFFHVSAGAETLNASGGRAAPLGVFVAPGAIGLALGTLYPRTADVLCGGAFDVRRAPDLRPR